MLMRILEKVTMKPAHSAMPLRVDLKYSRGPAVNTTLLLSERLDLATR
jgi:hypothetical protein